MVQVEKRRLIWQLHASTQEILDYADSISESSQLIPADVLLDVLRTFEFDDRSPVLIDIVKLALSDDREMADIGLLFHVISEAVSKVLDRNVLFWNTVMAVSSSSIAWIDFRRKLSKWLSTNGMGVSHIKNVIAFVQQNVDKTSSGIVRKDTFLKFTEEIMGIDCLLSPEALVESTTQAAKPSIVRKPAPIRPQPMRMNEVVMPPAQIEPSVSVVEPFHLATIQPALALTSVQQVVSTPIGTEAAVPPIQVREVSKELQSVRLRMGVGIFLRLAAARMRVFFHEMIPPAFKLVPVKLKSAEARNLISVVKVITQRVKFSAFASIRANSLLGIPVVRPEDEAGEDAGGPSWTVTIQAVAVANLFGILRTSLTRLTLPAFFSLKTGRCIDENYPPRRVLWSQSSQGKRDAQTAQPVISKGILLPIQENIGGLEFDLST